MSRILSANGHPMGSRPGIAMPGQINVDVTPHLTPQGVVLAVTIEGQPPMGIPLAPEVAVAIGSGLIAKAGQWALLQEQERQMRLRGGAQAGDGAPVEPEAGIGPAMPGDDGVSGDGDA